jgi:hypothetical protein
MASEVAEKDDNNVSTLIAVSSSNGTDILKLYADPTTHRLLVTTGGGGGSSGYQPATGTVNGSNTIFSFSLAPNVISVDQVPKQRVSSDGTINWTVVGTTVTLAIAPTFDIYGIN